MKQYLTEMHSFAAVMEYGGFTAAAKVLNVSKGLISQQVTRLEEALGTQLLFRSTRKLELTETGAAFLVYCQRLGENAEAGFDAVESLRKSPTGTVRITVPVSFGEIFLNDIITTFQGHHPDIVIELELENRYRNLKSDPVDMAIRAGLTDDPDQVAIPLGQLSELVCASPAYWRTNRPLITPTDLIDHNCINNFHYCKDNRWLFFGADGPQSIVVRGTLRLNHYPLIRNAACNNLGVARLPRYIAMAEIAAGRLETRLDAYKSPRSPISLVYPYQGALPLKNRLFIDFIRNWFHTRPDLLETKGGASLK
jgi:DNA-binding transcriptional LysR family regulator|tara:strand:+ start:525 stop:1454 length:930 start_codon:yes stop_codon:yes gene_type:complete